MITKPHHLTKQLVMLRRYALASMHDGASACEALHLPTSQTDSSLDDNRNLYDPNFRAAALNPVAKLWRQASILGVTADELRISRVHKLIVLICTQLHPAVNYTMKLCING